jgi:aminoglycoside 6-adenylyltransferase
MIDVLTGWAEEDANIRRLVLVGSRAQPNAPDDLADVDVQVYCDSQARFTHEDGWLADIGQVWLSVSDEYRDVGVHVSTRLVIFDGGVKVDFAFYPAGPVSRTTLGLPHRVLVEKDVVRRAIPPPGEAPDPPAVDAFRRVVDEFWFEAYHVAKYLARGELWLAKSRDWATKQWLAQMIDWHERVAGGRVPHAHAAGTRAAIGDETWQWLRGTFGAFDAEESWQALYATMSLFRRLAVETAAAQGVVYPMDLDARLSGMIVTIRRRGGRDVGSRAAGTAPDDGQQR